jgi:glutaredoxin
MTAIKDLYNPNPSQLVMYSTTWCPDCKRSRSYLTDHNIPHLEVDIGKDNDAFMFVERLTRRVRIPTLVFPDGTVMIEPSDDELARYFQGKSDE